MSTGTAIPVTVLALAAGIIATKLAARAYQRLLAAALEHRDRLVEDALNADLDFLDTEYRLLTTHAPNAGGECSYCGTPAPCIAARALGITSESA
jgi:hypothetical protein